MQIRTNCARCSSRFICLLCLSKYLTFSDDHRVESRCDPEEMLDAFVILVTIERRRVIVRTGMPFCDETTRDFVGGNPFVRDCVNLHSIARRQQQCFGAAGLARNGFGGSVARELLP